MNGYKTLCTIAFAFFLFAGLITTVLNGELRVILVSFVMAILAVQEVNYTVLKELTEERIAAWNVNGDGK